MNKIILVTGGAGFIGSHTCLLLLELGYRVIVIDSFVNSSKKSLDRVDLILKNKNINLLNRLKVVKGDLCNIESISEIFEETSKEKQFIEGVIHFAGFKSIQESINEPLKYWENNLIGTLNLLNVMKNYGCRILIFSSTAALYRTSHTNIFNENSPKSPSNPYGETKFTIERILESLSKSIPNYWKIANLRYFNPIGCHPSGLIGEDPINKPTNIFPLIIKAAAKKIEKLYIFGNDWPTQDGTGIRDYIHVMDLAEGHIKALEFLMTKNEGEFISLNIGRGQGVSVLELIKIFMDTNKVNIDIDFVERRQGDVSISIAENYLAKSLLKWSPSRSIEDMCLDGWKWHLLNPDGY